MSGFAKVTFINSGNTVEVPKGTTLLKAARLAGLQVDAICGGKGTCGKCRGIIAEGVVSEPTQREKESLSPGEIENGVALFCQRLIEGDVTAQPDANWASREDLESGKGSHNIELTEIDPIVQKRLLQMSPPSINDQVADLERILRDLPGTTAVDTNLVAQIPDLVRKAGYQITSALFNNQLIAIEEGNTLNEHYGLSIDIGTTSVAGYLVDMNTGEVIASASAANGQRVHGADVISRIDYTVEQSAGLKELQKLVVQTIDEIVAKLLAASGIAVERIYAVTMVGNTVMSHLLLGASPIGIATSPFVPAFSGGIIGTVDLLGLESLPPGSRFILLPNIAGYVGSDTVGLILSTKICEIPGSWLAIDIGTNGEVVLFTGEKLFTCSTAAGPAFEGAAISQGMRAEPGAVCKVTIEDDVYVSVVGDQQAKGICGSGLVDAVSQLVQLGVIRTNGRINTLAQCPAELSRNIKKRIVDTGKGRKFVLVEGENEVAITQKDISELQLGKAAIRAGIEILLEKACVQELDGILLAGAFGNNLCPKSLLGLGMLPKVDVNRVKPVGNAAGAGAIMALLSREELRKAMKLPEMVEHIELSLYAGFQRKFARALRFK